MSYLLLFLLLAPSASAAPPAPPSIRSNAGVVSVQDGEVLKQNAWRLSPDANPDVYEAELVEGRPHKVTFITDVDSISFMVEEGKQYDFIIRLGDRDCHTRIVGIRFTPAAWFDEAYRSAHQGRILVEVPEVYELVNVAIAMTPTGIADREEVYQDSEYYKRMRAWFDKHRDQPLLAALDAELAANPMQYFTLKMNGYAFEFDEHDKLVPSKVYDRTGFAGERRNTLRPYLEKLQAFSDATGFRRFFRENAATYQEQIAFFRDVADVGEMKRWLDRNFPTSSDYDGYKIIFSPLVAYNQSVTWLESNGFKELQAHVNYPYPEANPKDLSPRAAVLYRGSVVFTELNHGYINPEADKYADRIVKAVSDRDHWVDKSKGPDYYPSIALFNEYMNWALVSLRLVDTSPPDELAGMVARIDRMMVESRGFPRFKEFDAFLMDLYRARKPPQTVADLYPQIIEWFEKKGAVAPSPEAPRQ
jgi:hypothetical protein